MRKSKKSERNMNDYARKFYESLPFRLARAGTISFALYLGLLGIGSHISKKYSQEITSRQQIENIIEKEREKLDIDNNSIINVILGADISQAKRINENEYEIRLSPTNGKYHESTLVHELAHIGHGDCDHKTSYPSLKNGLNYFFGEEPRAILHSLKSTR